MRVPSELESQTVLIICSESQTFRISLPILTRGSPARDMAAQANLIWSKIGQFLGKSANFGSAESRLNDITTSCRRGYVDYSGALRIGTQKKVTFFFNIAMAHPVQCALHGKMTESQAHENDLLTIIVTNYFCILSLSCY